MGMLKTTNMGYIHYSQNKNNINKNKIMLFFFKSLRKIWIVHIYIDYQANLNHPRKMALFWSSCIYKGSVKDVIFSPGNTITLPKKKCVVRVTWALVPICTGLVTTGTGIVFIGNMLSWLCFHNFVWWSLNAHISIISPNIWDLFSKSNSSVYYF